MTHSPRKEWRPKEKANLNAFRPDWTERKFWKNNAIYKDAKGNGIYLTRSVCTDFPQLPLLVLGDENVTFPRHWKTLSMGDLSSGFQEKKGRAQHPFWTGYYQVPSAKVYNICGNCLLTPTSIYVWTYLILTSRFNLFLTWMFTHFVSKGLIPRAIVKCISPPAGSDKISGMRTDVQAGGSALIGQLTPSLLWGRNPEKISVGIWWPNPVRMQLSQWPLWNILGTGLLSASPNGTAAWCGPFGHPWARWMACQTHLVSRTFLLDT